MMIPEADLVGLSEAVESVLQGSEKYLRVLKPQGSMHAESLCLLSAVALIKEENMYSDEEYLFLRMNHS